MHATEEMMQAKAQHIQVIYVGTPTEIGDQLPQHDGKSGHSGKWRSIRWQGIRERCFHGRLLGYGEGSRWQGSSRWQGTRKRYPYGRVLGDGQGTRKRYPYGRVIYGSLIFHLCSPTTT